jgi:hypothetical protein
LSRPRTRMRASRFPNTDEKSRVNTMPMAAPPGLRGGGARGRASAGAWPWPGLLRSGVGGGDLERVS